LPDDKKLYFGSHSDQYMYYDGTDNIGYWRATTGDIVIRVEENDHDIRFQSDDGSGGIDNYMVIDGGATSIDLLKDTRLAATKKLYLDGGGNTYIFEESADNVIHYVGGQNKLRFNSTGTILNDAGLALDFRVEGDTDANLLFVDGSADSVGIGTASPAHKLDVLSGSARFYSTGATELYIGGAGAGHHQGAIVFSGTATDASYRGQGMYHHDAASDIEYFTGTLYANDAWAVTRKTSTASHDAGVAQGSHALLIVEGGGDVGIGLSNPNGKLHVKDATDISMSSSGNGQLMVEGNGYTGGIALDGNAMHIYHNSSSRSLRFGTNETTRYQIDGSGNHQIYGNTDFSSPMTVQYGATINEGGHDSDTRIEGSSDANLFRVDAGNDRVGIGTGSPGNKFTVNSTGTHQASIQYDASTRLQISVEDSGKARFYTDNNANVGIESGGLYVQPTNKFFLDGGNDTYIKESSANVMEFYCGNSRRMQLTTTYLSVPDNAYLAAGDNNEVFIRHDGNGHFQSNAGEMYINNVANTNIFFSTNNTERLRIDNQGNLRFADNGTNPSAVANTAFMFNDGGELKVLDELGSTTTISPHNFELIPEGASEDMAWSHHSVKGNKTVNVDMMRLARLVEELTGEKLVYTDEQ